VTSYWFFFPIQTCAPQSVVLRWFLQRDNLGSGLNQTIVAMISSNLARRGHPSRVFIPVSSPEGRAAALRLDSVIMTDNLATVMENEIDSILGHLTDITKVNAALRHTLGI
jgi:mRNA interferase MazF